MMELILWSLIYGLQATVIELYTKMEEKKKTVNDRMRK